MSSTSPPDTKKRPDPLAALPRLDRHKPKCGPVRPSRVSRWRAIVLIAVHVVIGLHILHWLMAGKTLTPVEPSEAMQTLELGKINAGFVLFVVLILGTLVFGRWFCGWACHVVAIQDLSAWLLGKAGLRPRPVRSRLLVLAPWVVAGHMFAWPRIERWLDPSLPPLAEFAQWEEALLTEELWATFPGPVMSVATFVVVGFLMIWWLGAKGFCTHGCPYGAFFALADRLAPLRIKVSPACDACGHCTQVCSSNVRVHEEVARHGRIVDPGCMKCMDCVSVCPKEALSFGWSAPKPFAISQQRLQARADFEWFEEVLMALVAIWACEFAFRGAWFWEQVPFLLSAGLGVLTAVAAVAALRLLTRRDLQFQHWQWKLDGRFTRAGRVGAAVVAGWLLLALYTWQASSLVRAADSVRAQLMTTELSAAQRQDLLQQTDAAYARAESWAPIGNPHLHLLRGLAQRELGQYESAERQLRQALRLLPDWAPAAVPLTDLLNLRGQIGEAEQVLRRVLAEDPTCEPARKRLELLEARKAQGR
ncbi:MAG: 4Fe-4S binding protein [Planctomycetes bacterium]|nr:4Fe-4S binding protein [Planctomycetota bacterium]